MYHKFRQNWKNKYYFLTSGGYTMKWRRVKPNPSSLLWITICLGDRVLRTEAEAVWTTQLVGSRLLSRLDEDPGAGDMVAGVHVCSRCNRAASWNNNVIIWNYTGGQWLLGRNVRTEIQPPHRGRRVFTAFQPLQRPGKASIEKESVTKCLGGIRLLEAAHRT